MTLDLFFTTELHRVMLRVTREKLLIWFFWRNWRDITWFM